MVNGKVIIKENKQSNDWGTTMIGIFIALLLMCLGIFMFYYAVEIASLTACLVAFIILFLAFGVASVALITDIIDHENKQKQPQVVNVEKHENNETVLTTENYQIIIKQIKKD